MPPKSLPDHSSLAEQKLALIDAQGVLRTAVGGLEFAAQRLDDANATREMREADALHRGAVELLRMVDKLRESQVETDERQLGQEADNAS